MKVLLFWPLLLLASTGTILLAQDPLDSLDIELPDTVAIRAPQHLDGFLQKLDRLYEGRKQRITIVHLGDSHVQADYLTGYLRRRWQQRYGNAGRGLVFPYAQASTHGPLDLNWQTDAQWVYRRRTFSRRKLPVGIAGMTVQTTGDFTLQLSSEQAFDRLRIFFEDDPAFAKISVQMEATNREEWIVYQVQPGDTLYQLAQRFGCSVRDLQIWNLLPADLIRVEQQLRIRTTGSFALGSQPIRADSSGQLVHLPRSTRNVTLYNSARQPTRLYGAVLENAAQAGIRYDMIGVNGTTYFHYWQAQPFWKQLSALRPDLLVITLGSNEALQSRFDASQMKRSLTGFFDRLRKNIPDCPVLLTWPPPIAKGAQYARHRDQIVRLLSEMEAEYQLASWDWSAAMGGTDQMKQWMQKGLAQSDSVHFTKTGYFVIAESLYRSILQARAQRLR